MSRYVGTSPCEKAGSERAAPNLGARVNCRSEPFLYVDRRLFKRFADQLATSKSCVSPYLANDPLHHLNVGRVIRDVSQPFSVALPMRRVVDSMHVYEEFVTPNLLQTRVNPKSRRER